MTFKDEFEKRYGKKEYQVLNGLRHVAKFNSDSFWIKEALKASSTYIESYEKYSRYLNSKNRYRLYMAAGIGQMLDSLDEGEWQGPNFPDYDDAKGKVTTTIKDHPGMPIARLKYLKNQKVEKDSLNLIGILASDGFLFEYNDKKYDPETQLYLANRLGIYLTDSTAGYDFIVASVVSTNSGKILPVFHPNRFADKFRSIVPSDNYTSPETDEPDADSAPLIKAFGDFILGALLSVEKRILEGMAQHAVGSSEGRKSFKEMFEATAKRFNKDLTFPESFTTIYPYFFEDPNEGSQFIKTLKKYSIYVSAPMISMISIFSAVYSVVTYDRNNPDTAKLVGVGKDLLSAGAAVIDVYQIVRQRRGLGISPVLNTAGKVTGVVTGVVDVALKFDDAIDTLYKDPKNFDASLAMLAGSSLTFGGMAYLGTSLALTGPVGIGLVLVGLGLSLLGAWMVEPDTIIEQIIRYSAFGTDKKHDVPSLDKPYYGFYFKPEGPNLMWQWGAYFNLLYGFSWKVEGEAIGNEKIRLYFTLTVTRHHLPAKTSVLIVNNEDIPVSETRFRTSWSDRFDVRDVSYTAPWANNASVDSLRSIDDATGEWVIREWRVIQERNIPGGIRNINAYFGKYFQAQITFYDDATLSLIKSLIGKQADINPNQIPIQRSMSTVIRGPVKPLNS